MSDIGSLPGPVPGNAPPIVSEAYGVNDSGQITGLTLGGSSHPETYHAFIYQSGTMTDLGLGVGNAINANGQVTGSLTASPALGTGNAQLGRAFLYNGGAITDLGVLPGGSFSSGYAIHASGRIHISPYPRDPIDHRALCSKQQLRRDAGRGWQLRCVGYLQSAGWRGSHREPECDG
jgi:probable HAF family extracellular repeat protein